MSEKPEGKPRWWQTVPGILTGVAAIITAVTGMVLAFNAIRQARSGGDVPKPVISSPPIVSASAPSAGADAVTSVTLPEIHQIKLAGGAAVITVLSAELEPIEAERRSLKFVVRHLNTSRYATNFWSSSYRLLIDDIPRAPTNDLNEIIPGDSAKEGEVVFEVPARTRDVVLQISSGEEKRRIPFRLP